jgi:hypothetical protein
VWKIKSEAGLKKKPGASRSRPHCICGVQRWKRFAAWLLRDDTAARLAAEHEITTRIAGWHPSVGAMLAARGINPARLLATR